VKPLKRIRVLVVDDSIVFRETLCTNLSANSKLEVVGSATDSFDAMEKIKQLNPDVVTLDVEMPKVNGIDFLKKLMPINPLPVVVVSSMPDRAFEALDAGAVDFVRKPMIKSPTDVSDFINELIVKIKIASAAHIRKKPVLATLPTSQFTANIDNNMVIAIGASTGGTEAILSVIKDLPATTPGIVVVQHMPPVFTKMYAQRLDKICAMTVKEAENLERVEKGKVIIAAGDSHLTLARDSRGFYVKSRPGERVSGHCPSVDVLFHSVAAVAGANSIGILLTGMGADGAKGLLKMRQSGAYTIGQNKESCVVYGMPMVAYNIGAVTKQLPLLDIQEHIICYMNKLGNLKNNSCL